MQYQHKHGTQGALLAETTRRLAVGGVREARQNAVWMLQEVLACSRAQLLAYPERAVAAEQVRRLESLLARRLRREPLQYVLGHADFFGLRLIVTPAVLIPRPETEQVVEEALRLIQGITAPRVLDVGTGSGCIALALRHARPDAHVFACDVSADALAVARDNAENLSLPVTFFRADALAPDFAQQAPGALDLLISNPPYLPDDEAATLQPEVRDFEPHRALFTGPDLLLYYRAITGHASSLLKPGGLLVFETHADHAGAVADLLREAAFEKVQEKPDLAGHPRIVTGRAPR